MKRVLLSLIAVLSLTFVSAQENSDVDKKWQARFRWVGIFPNETLEVGGEDAPINIYNQVIPELDFTYFFTENLSAELILGTAKHDVKVLDNVDLGHVWLLPPTLSLQYHFEAGKLRPYIGVSANYTIFYNVDNGAFDKVEYENAFGYGGQLGLDYDLDDTWFLNIDAKYLLLSTEVTLNEAIKADVEINPLLIGFGVGMRF